jgi:hypothetical protein
MGTKTTINGTPYKKKVTRTLKQPVLVNGLMNLLLNKLTNSNRT